MVEALLAHGLDGFGAGGGLGDGGDGFEAERGDCGAVEGVVLDRAGAAVSGFGLGGERGCGREEVVCSEPVVVDELRCC